MSRVTEAMRKSRAAASVGSAQLPHIVGRVGDGDSWMTTEAPWDLDEPPEPCIAPATADLAKSPVIGDICGQSLAGLHGELTPLVQRLLQTDAGEGRIRSVLFSCVGSPGGSAELCAAAAAALASQTTGSVCLVDGNLRSPSLHALFEFPSALGFSDLLLHTTALRACLTKLRPNLWLLPAGSRCTDALPILVTEHLRPALVQLLTTFDYAVLNVSAADAYDDIAALGALVDGVVLVLEANATRREVARRTAAHLQAANVRVLGAVLTNRTFPIPEAIYRRL